MHGCPKKEFYHFENRRIFSFVYRRANEHIQRTPVILMQNAYVKRHKWKVEQCE